MTHTQFEQQVETAQRLAAVQANAPLELAVVLPTLNEKANIAPMVERLEAALGPSGWEAVFVDDNSSDGTAEEARRIGQSDPRIRVIQRIGRRGLASAAIEGMCATAAPFVAVMDADHQHDPALLNDMLASLRSGECDLAYASRFAVGGNAMACLQGPRKGQPRRQCAGPQADRHRSDRRDERLFPAAHQPAAQTGGTSFGHRLQDHARYPFDRAPATYA